MLRTEELALACWREACRHLEIGEACQLFAKALANSFPLRWLALVRLDEEPFHPFVAASAPVKELRWEFPPFEVRSIKRLGEWVESGDPVHIRPRSKLPTPLSPLALDQWPNSEKLVLPLAGEHGSRGVAVLCAEEERTLNQRHYDIAKVIGEPLSVALDNDKRLHELTVLREAAEADRLTLLSRLGRTDLGDTVIGESTGLKQVMERVRLVTKTEVPTLILGETGTGKELVARLIHQGSPRRQGPFIRVNCGAIPTELIDSQLFGHEKGSFTGAVDARAGWFERADKGTLFLDEIGELPLEAQVRFLRVLQDGIVERVGGATPIHVNVRVVAATHRDLSEMVRAGKFREDLWYRIAVFPILLPPLRDRRQDIPALVDHLARKAASRFGLAPVHAGPQDIQILQNYDWPGNVRELGAVIDRAAILGEGVTLEIAKALGVFTSSSDVKMSPSRVPSETQGGALSLDDAMRSHISSVLSRTQGQIEGSRGAASILKINPHTLRARMRKLGINWRNFRQGGEFQ